MTVALCVTLALPGVVDINVDVPASRIPLATIASAAARTSESVTLSESGSSYSNPWAGWRLSAGIGPSLLDKARQSEPLQVTGMLPEQTGDGNAYKLPLFINENNSGLTKNLTLMHKYHTSMWTCSPPPSLDDACG